MPANLKKLHLQICLGAVALMVSMPFLMAHHYNPIPTFFQEWTAAALSLVALTALLNRSAGQTLEMPVIALLPIGLMLIAVMQWLFLPDVLADRLLMFGNYMVWATLLVVLGRHLAAHFGLRTLADLMATAILVAALLEALTGAVQLAGMARLPWVFPVAAGGLKGNLAQPNNFADYLWLGVASAIYLRSRTCLGVTSTSLCLLILLPFSVLSGSRSVWLYALGLPLLSLIWSYRQDSADARRLRNGTIWALAGGIFFQMAFSHPLISLPDTIATSGSRLAEQGSYDPMRTTLWRIAFETFLENPWLGAGFGQYTRQFHLHVLDLMPFRLPGLPEHSHNLLLNLLAEMGMGAGLLLVGFGLHWLLSLVRAPRRPEFWWIWANSLVLLIHSNLEYPLWYGFFLGIAALLAGAASRTNRILQSGRMVPYALAAFLALGALTLQNLYRDYSLLEDTLNGRIAAGSPEERREMTKNNLQQVARESLLRPYVDLTVAHLMEDSESDLQIKLENCNRAQRFSASRDIVFKCAHLLVLAGRTEEGELALRRAVASYPDKAEQVLERWKKRSQAEPVMARLVANFPTVASAPPR